MLKTRNWAFIQFRLSAEIRPRSSNCGECRAAYCPASGCLGISAVDMKSSLWLLEGFSAAKLITAALRADCSEACRECALSKRVSRLRAWPETRLSIGLHSSQMMILTI
jgi:hypothetical protein